jgi:hypothetical protein
MMLAMTMTDLMRSPVVYKDGRMWSFEDSTMTSNWCEVFTTIGSADGLLGQNKHLWFDGQVKFDDQWIRLKKEVDRYRR